MRRVPHGELRFRTRWGLTDRLALAGRQAWLAGLGAVVAVNETGREAFTSLVSAGEELAARRRENAADLQDKLDQSLTSFRQTLEDARGRATAVLLNRLGLPGRNDVAALARQIDRLQGTLDNLAEEA